MLTDHYAHGKLLLTGEYFVLDGATALAVPTRLGQTFHLAPTSRDSRYDLTWTTANPVTPGHETYTFITEDWQTPPHDTQDPVRARLCQLFYAAEQLNPECTVLLRDKLISTRLEFDPTWGLGSSSTLVHFLARLLGVNPYALLELSFGGSGYDVACAGATGPLLYRRDGHIPAVNQLDWNPPWLAQTYFVHLNRKQNSREGIRRYRQTAPAPEVLAEVSQLTQALTDPTLHPRAAAQLLERHERLVSKVLGLQQVGERFADLDGTVKSLGAWGGDFVWVLGERPAEEVRRYFNARGYGTFIPYHDLVL